jgi:flagellar FliL protein
MTAEADIDEAAEAPAKGKPGKKTLLIGAAAAVLVLVAVAGGYFVFFSGSSSPAKDSHLSEVSETFIFNLPTMLVNLNSGERGEQFMKLSVALEVANEEMMLEIQPRMAKVVDAFQVYLRELRRSDLEGSAGIYRLKEELRRRVNVAIFPAQVESILFKEILVQ